MVSPADRTYFLRLENILKKEESSRRIEIDARVLRCMDIISFKQKIRVNDLINDILRKHIMDGYDETLKEFLQNENWVLEFCPAFTFRKKQALHVNKNEHVIKKKGEPE